MKRELIYKIFSKIPQLETDRLLLRKMMVSDAHDMYEYARRSDVTTFLTWNPHPSRSYTRNYLEYVATKYSTGSFYDWAVIEKKSGRMIGTCGFTKFDFPSNGAEIGYVINPDYRGNGYAVEAAGAVMNFAFNVLKVMRLEANYMEGNQASRRVMDKLGMSYEGMRRSAMLVKNQYKNICTCSIIYDEFKSNTL